MPTIAFAQLETEPQVHLDAHIHYPEPSYKGDISSRVLGLFKHAFLISPSFKITRNRRFTGDESWRSDFSLRHQLNKQVSDYIAKYPNKFSGVCAINLEWEDAQEILAQCLALPHMVGLKIHSEESKVTMSNGGAAKLAKIFSALQGRIRFVIWHVKTDYYESTEIMHELTEVLKIVSANPQVGFILAHSLYWPEGLSELNQWLQKSKNKNLYVDVSTNLDIDSGVLLGYYVEHWKKFNFDHLLFGSDVWIQFYADLELIISSFTFAYRLKPGEKSSLLRENGQAFMKKYLE